MTLSSLAIGFLAINGALSPPVMSPRDIGPPTEIIGGSVHLIKVGETEASLFVPKDVPPSSKSHLWVHFHTADWFIFSEYQRGKITEPILNFNLGQGSTTYAQPFSNKEIFEKFILNVETILNRKVGNFHVTSFSAGYGAVRNLIQDDYFLERIKTVILCDSLYGSITPDTSHGRQVLPEHVSVWQPLIERAKKNQTTFVITTSQITPETYAGSWEVAAAMVKQNNSKLVKPNPLTNAAQDPVYPLIKQFQEGSWYVWCYDGNDARAHMTHPRRLAEILIQMS